MATAAPSPLASSVEKTNGNKLSRLLIDGGTTVLKNVFDRYHSPSHLAAALNSNYSILNNLLRKRILNRHQWDKLFPPGGAVPDSNTFDITLLFLLLTTICGLSPPLSGWHAKPSPGDNSLEANLARVKFFRNVLYGHVTSTGVDTASFSSMWLEISTTLHSLGLDQAEIDKLKAERGGEEDHLNVLFEWIDSEQEVKLQLNKRQEEHRDIQKTLLQIKDTVDSVEHRKNEVKENDVLKKLAVVNTKRVTQNHAEKYQQGTRKSIFEKVSLWLNDQDSENRVMVITGDAGMGKSVIAAVVCHRMQQAGQLAANHFCQHSKARFRNPKVMLQSLAFQLCEVLPQYKNELVQALSRNLGEDINSLEVGELFELLFEEPLRSVGDPGKIVLMVIDGLDESEYKGRNELLDLIANHFCTLPVWLRFLVTTRPEINIADHLRKFNPLQLKQNDEENVKDIRLFLKTQLCNVIQSGCEEIIIDELVRKAAGHILYAYLMVDFIKKDFSIFGPEDLSRPLPSGVSSVYQSYFERLEKELQIGEEQFLTFLSALAAASEPLPLDFVSKMFLSDKASLAGRRKVREAVRSISTLLPVQDDRIDFFHKSVKDWLSDKTAYGEHNFSVDEKQGHLILSQLCTDELNGVKEKGVHSSEFSNTAKYALQHGVHHMLESEEGTRVSSNFQEIVKNYAINLEIVYAKLYVNEMTTSEDIIRVQKQELFGALSSEIQGALETLLFLLRKYHEILSTRPSVFFQVMVNSGGDVLAAKTKELLQTKYHQIPYMRCVDQQAEKEEMTGTKAVFRCMSRVTCFDVSFQQDFVVCECMDESIQLWSLQTGKLWWKRPVKVEKYYVDDYHTFRVVSNSSVLSCYRSVVFHPTEPIVLPGILSQAYSIDGELIPLFAKSNCRFVVCSICGDKMITDSPDDAKRLVMWNLKTGDEISGTIRNEIVLSFAWSPDGKLLVISHLSGLVCLVDVLNCFQTLAEVTLSKPCGMIRFEPAPFSKFSRDMKSLNCMHMLKSNFGISIDTIVHATKFESTGSTVRWVLNPTRCFGFSDNYGLPSKGGFLTGDPHFSFNLTFAFVLNEHSVVRGYPSKNFIQVLSPLNRNIKKSILYGESLRHVAFALDGETIYGVTDKNAETIYGDILGIGKTVVSFNVSSRELKYFFPSGNRSVIRRLQCSSLIKFDYNVSLVPVTKGVVFNHRRGGLDVQLWNFELSQIVRSWPSLCEVTYIMPFSDQCVACVGREFEVSILDTSSGDIVKTIPLCHEGYKSTYPLLYKEAIVCNKKYQLLSTDHDSLQLSDGKSVLWSRLWINSLLNDKGNLSGMFSPKEEFVLISVTMAQEYQLGLELRKEVHVLDTTLGHTLRTLCTVEDVYDCAFVSNTECVISCRSILQGYCLQLFNVRSGDLLSFLDTIPLPSCLASFPQNGLIAIGLCDSSASCIHPFIEVKLRRDKVKEEAKDSRSSTHRNRDGAVVQRALGSYLFPTDDDDDDDGHKSCHDDDDKDSGNNDGSDCESNDAGDNDGEDGNDFDLGSAGEYETTEEELPQQIPEVIQEGSVEDMDAPDSDKIRIHRGTVTSEGAHWALPLGAVHLMFPPNAVSEPASVEVHRWKYSVRSPPLQEHEAITSNVIELSSIDGQHLKFNTKVTLLLSHSATDLRGYELVIKRLIDKQENKWEDLHGTRDVRCRQGIEDRYPSHKEMPDNFFPVAQADITECSTYAVVSRLKSSPTYTITSNGGSFSHPDFPGVAITVPENSVAPNTNFRFQLKVQEVPSDEFQEEGAFLGPILRINCFEVIQFLTAVTIKLPISLRGQQDLNLDPSTRRVRVLFVNSDDENKEWVEITDDLVRPASFDGKFVRFQVKGFSWFSYFLESCSYCSDKLRITSFLKRMIWVQPRPAVFMCYFCPNRCYTLCLACCHVHLQTQEIQRLKEENITPVYSNSMKDMIPGYDKAFVLLSGGICPSNKEDMKNISLRLLEDDGTSNNRAFKTELEVLSVEEQDRARVEFYSNLETAENASLLCKLSMQMPSQDCSRNTDRVNLEESGRQPSDLSPADDDDDDDGHKSCHDDDDKDSSNNDGSDCERNDAGDNDGEDGNDFDMGSVGEDETTEEELPQQIPEKGSVEDMDAPDSDKIRIHRLSDDDRKSDNRPIVLEVDPVNNKDSARVECHNTSKPAGNTSLLCQLHVPMPSQNASSIIDHARSYARKPLRVISLGDEWGSSKGGLSTLNRELAKRLAQQPDVAITLLLPRYSDKDKQEASDCNVSLATPEPMTDFDPIKGLRFPRDDLGIDVVIGHGRKFGAPAQVIATQRKCKRVHFVHTASEELAMFKTGDKTISEGEKKHQVEIDLCENADIVVAIGPKLTDDVSANLRACGKDKHIINITPGVFSEFSKLKQSSKENENFRILVFGRGDPEDFELKGYDIAAEAVKSLEDQTYLLIFVGAPEGKEDEVKDKLLECGISRDQLRVRGFIESRQRLEKCFCEADLAIMPSRTEGYGLTALEALSAGLPILVSKNSGFGKVVQALPFGDSVVVGSDNADEWGKAIKRMRNKRRETRLQEACSLRESYDELYKWEEQCEKLAEKMQSLFN